MAQYSKRTEHAMHFNNFRGIDTFNSPLNVDNHHASSSYNWTFKDNVLCKRSGFEPLISLESLDEGKINGFWEFQCGWVVHHAKQLFYVKDNVQKKLSSEIDETKYIQDQKSFAYPFKEKLILFVGDIYVFDGETLVREVDDYILDEEGNPSDKWKSEIKWVGSPAEFLIGNRHIPITITDGRYYGGGENRGTDVAFEKINLLTAWQVVKYNINANMHDFWGKVHADTAAPYVTIMLPSEMNTSDSVTYRRAIFFGSMSKRYGSIRLEDNYIILKGRDINEGDNHIYASVEISETTGAPFVKYEKIIIGRIDRDSIVLYTNIEYKKGDIKKTVKEIRWTVREICFCYIAAHAWSNTLRKNRKRVTSAKVGGLFGENNNHLFVSSDYADFYSESDNFLYFPDTNYTNFGVDTSPIGAYLPLSRGVQGIVKFNPSLGENSMFVRKMSTRNVYSEGQVIGEEIEPVLASVGVCAYNSALNMSNDNYIVSTDGVFCIVNEQFNNELRLVKISFALDGYLKERNYTFDADISVFGFDDTLYIAKGEDVFVGKKFGNDFEWNIWKNNERPLNYSIIKEINGQLYFSRELSIDILNNERFSDVARLYGGVITPRGDIPDPELHNFYFLKDDSETFSLCSISGGAIGYKLSKRVDSDIDGRSVFEGSKDEIDLIMQVAESKETKVFTYVHFGDPLSPSHNTTRYGTIKNATRISKEKVVFELTYTGYSNNTIIILLNPPYACHTEEFINESGYKMKKVFLHKGALPLTLIKTPEYGEVLTLISMKNIPIVAEYCTSITNLGAPFSLKNIKRMCALPELINDGKLQYGYKTIRGANVNSIGTSKSFSFNDIDFTKFSFSPKDFPYGQASSICERDVSLMQVVFKSEEPCAASMNDISVQYTITRETKGVE